MKINRNNLSVRLNKWMFSAHPKTLCSFFWTSLFATLAFLLTLPVTIVGIICTYAIYAILPNNAWDTFSSGLDEAYEHWSPTNFIRSEWKNLLPAILLVVAGILFLFWVDTAILFHFISYEGYPSIWGWGLAFYIVAGIIFLIALIMTINENQDEIGEWITYNIAEPIDSKLESKPMKKIGSVVKSVGSPLKTIREYLKATKQKMCPIIQYTDEDGVVWRKCEHRSWLRSFEYVIDDYNSYGKSGYGNYKAHTKYYLATATEVSDQVIKVIDIVNGNYDKKFTHVYTW